ncbi:MAG TPA: DUF3572 domain-containing protein [Thermohalobaculum sp.]|nr:DUF3572 domain-containing protein [Thermohalobaculum sp.]
MRLEPMVRPQAEALAVQALAWMAGDPELIGRFLAATGAGPADLRVRAAEPEFLGFVLDFLLSDEAALVAFAAAANIRPDLPMRARVALPGGDLPNWT